MKATTLALAAALAALATPSLAGDRVYVPMGGANEVLIIDSAQDKVIGRVGGTEEAHGLAGTADGKLLVVGSYTEEERKGPKTPPKPKGVSKADHAAHHPKKGGKAPMMVLSGPISDVSVINTADRSIIRKIPVKGAVHHMNMTPDGRYAITTNPGINAINIIDMSKFMHLKTLPTGPSPNYAVSSKDSKTVYVSNTGNNTISEVDTANWFVRRNILVGAGPEHLVLSPDGKTLYTNNAGDGTVSVISTGNGQVVKTYKIGGSAHGIDLSSDAKTLFVAGKEQNKLVAIDLETGAMRSADLGPAPYHLTSIATGGKLYVSSAEEDKIWVVDQKTLKIKTEIKVPDTAHQMVVATN